MRLASKRAASPFTTTLMRSTLRISLAILGCAAAIGTAHSRGQAQAEVRQPPIKVTLLGTAPGPPVRVGRAGISTLVEAAGQRFLFDAGYGSLARLVESGLPMDAVTKLFLTHLHSDHLVDLPAFVLLPWAAPSARDEPLEVWGPSGTRDMVRHLEQAFGYDIHVRRDIDERASAKGIEVIGRDVREGIVYDQGGVKITAFLVDHGPVTPAFGYRVDHGGRAVAISGDTRPSDNLVKFSKGVDVLIHEAVDEVSLKKFAPSQRLFEAIVAHHTTPEQAADIFRRVAPRVALFSHADGGAAVTERTRRTYPGRVEFGEDLMVIEIGDEVVVRRRGAGPLR